MLSLYDALCFSVQRKNLLMGWITAIIMLSFFILIGFSLESYFQLFSAFKTWLLAETGSPKATSALAQMALTLLDDNFWPIVFQKTLWACFMMFILGLSFFALEVVIAKKALFNQPPKFTVNFFIITLGKLMLLLAPLLFAIYHFLRKLLLSLFGYYYSTQILNTETLYHFPFSGTSTTFITFTAIFYFVLIMVLFIERFSFKSLLNLKLIVRNSKVMLELSLKIMQTFFLWGSGMAIIAFLYWRLNTVYACFIAIVSYLIWMALYHSARLIFSLPLFTITLGFLTLNYILGWAFSKNYLFSYISGMLCYFCLFFLWAMFWGTLAYLFASTAYVFRFKTTASKDIKEQAPGKLRRLDEMYNEYLQAHNNKEQQNFFHKLEDKRK